MNEFQPGDALLVVDVQNDFCPGGALGVPGGEEIVPILNNWIRKAHEAGIPVCFSRDWHPAHHVSFEERGGPWPPHCVQHTRGAELHGDLLLPENALVINKADTLDKDSYSAFGATSLADQLWRADVRRLWVGGLALDYCVMESALDAESLGFEVHLLLDATRAVDANPGDACRAVERMQAGGVHIERGS